jgi:hypothetical protein
LIQCFAVLTSFAGIYPATDISLTPGKNASKLNLNWQTTSSSSNCAAQVAKKNTTLFKNAIPTKKKTATDSNGLSYSYCEVEVSNLTNNTNYNYRVGDGVNWSAQHPYSTRNSNNYSFFFVADPQIGASGNAASDGIGWTNTLTTMNEEFPDAAFIMSAGDQVDTATNEDQYTNFFSPVILTSLPVAPAVGNHEGAAANFNYHYNLPNESSTYGVNSAGGDYYFTYGNSLFMVLNMEPTNSLYPGSGGGPGGPPPDTDKDGVDDGHDYCPNDVGLATNNGCPEGQTGTKPEPPGPPPCSDIISDADFSAKLAAKDMTAFVGSINQHKAFMQKAIAANPTVKWKVVMWHYSIYSAGNHAADSQVRAIRYYMVDVLDDLEVDLVLMGHDHAFTRTYQMYDDDPQIDQTVKCNGMVVNPTGTLYLTESSSSGSKYYELHCKYPADPYFEYVDVGAQLHEPQFSYISVDANSLSISTYRTDTMQEIDTYSIFKNK